MGKKYIIELEDQPFQKMEGTVKKLWRVKGFNSLVFDEVGLSKLQPYGRTKAADFAIGEEVEVIDTGTKFVVTEISETGLFGFDSSGKNRVAVFGADKIQKTGKYIEAVANLLRSTRDDSKN